MRQRKRAAIAAGSESATAAGTRLLELGGNAADIAVGMALTAMSAEILMCSLGGSALVMVHRPGRVTELVEGADAMPGQERPRPAPEPRWREAHVPGEHGSRIRVRAGHAAVAVPGALAALEAAWQRHGSLPWRELVAPGYELAREGIPTAPETARWLAAASDLFTGHEPSRQSFFPDGAPGSPPPGTPGSQVPGSASPAPGTPGSQVPGSPAPQAPGSPAAPGSQAPGTASPAPGSPGSPAAPAPGTPLRIPYLADALDYIAREGARAFYRGDIAALFAREMEAGGGLLTRADLAAYQAAVRRPLSVVTRSFTLSLPPPPSVAGAAAGALAGLLELDWDLHPGQAQRALYHARVQARVLELGPAIHTAAVEGDVEAARALLSPEALLRYIEALRAPSTTHISVVTDDGDAVSITATMGHGAGVTIPGTGIPCNGSAGAVPLDGDGELMISPGTRLISNLCPSVAFSERLGTTVALGAIGASRAPTALAQVWMAHAREGLPLEAAVVAPRLHVERRDVGLVVCCEPGIPTRMLEQGLEVQAFEGPDRFFGRVTVAARDGQGRLLTAVDSR
jgi:gamma-glutamyltranspeptidase/glutathione hydrolase